MEMLHNLVTGFGVAFGMANLLCVVAGCLLGTVLGALPGLGPVAAMALLLPFAATLSPVSVLIFLVAIYCGAHHASAVRANLLRPLGKVDTANAVAAFLAGCACTLVLAACAHWLAAFAQQFGAVEYLALMVLALVCSAVLSFGSLTKALAMVLLGLLLGLVGTDGNSSTVRFALDIPEFSNGLNPVVVAMGLFGYGEVISTLAQPDSAQLLVVQQPWHSWRPHVASNALAQAALMPLFALGVPTSAAMAVVWVAMASHHIQPGPAWMGSTPEVFWGVVAALCVGNVGLVLRSPRQGLWRRLVRVPGAWLSVGILLCGAMGAYASSHHVVDVWLLCAFGLAGYVFKRLDMQIAPLLMGLVLAPAMEERLRQALELSHGDWSVFVMRPVSAGMLLLAVFMLLLLVFSGAKVRRAARFIGS